jgi:hypothetical protein
MPEGTEAEHAGLKAGIQAIGLQYAIKVLKGTDGIDYLLKGRRRLRSCRDLGIIPKVEYVEIPEGSSVAIYTAAEGAKREGTTTQKVLLAIDLMPEFKRLAAERQHHLSVTMRQGGENGKASACAAKVVGVSPRSVESALWLMKNRPDLFERKAPSMRSPALVVMSRMPSYDSSRCSR